MSREYVRDRLHNWAAWLTQRDSSSLGYPKINLLQMARGRPASVDYDVTLIDSVAASETHRAVQALRGPQVRLWLALMCRYVGNPALPASRRRQMTHAEIGQQMAVTERTALAWVTEAESAVDVALSVSQRTASAV
jgi:hypothetical protein